MEETIIISLGGSLIVPEEIDFKFLAEFRDLILSHVARGRKFAIITGGGRTCRKYQNATKELFNNATKEDLDWVGIAANNLNAELVRVIFGGYAHNKVIVDLSRKLSFDKPIVIGGAYEPGHSSDFDATVSAKTLGAKKIINLSNTDFVYDSDPKLNPDAKKIEKISWAEYRKIIPKEWTVSGLNTPFDPIASKMAEEEGMEVVIMNGKNIPNLERCLNGEDFIGTHIR
ncbi:MAG TPA: UMP kinase [Candidatus Paceibacterota bacterium]|jgi:uridylate kinase|nr:UMP kinase [Candidatus Paceibacterota bacterium]